MFNAYNVEFSNLDKIFKLTFGERRGKLNQYVTSREPEKHNKSNIFSRSFEEMEEKVNIYGQWSHQICDKNTIINILYHSLPRWLRNDNIITITNTAKLLISVLILFIYLPLAKH